MSEKHDIWIDAYPDKEHCSHCHDAGYKEGFFDAGISGVLILVCVLMAISLVMRCATHQEQMLPSTIWAVLQSLTTLLMLTFHVTLSANLLRREPRWSG